MALHNESSCLCCEFQFEFNLVGLVLDKIYVALSSANMKLQSRVPNSKESEEYRFHSSLDALLHSCIECISGLGTSFRA